MLKQTIVSLAALCLLLQACDGPEQRLAQPADLAGINPARAGQCDETVVSHCLFPFPNNHFTAPDPDSVTGLRIHLQEQMMPVANPVSIPASPLAPAGVETSLQQAVDPSEWNRNDGFSPGSMLLAHLPGIDLEQSRAPRLSDLSTALDEDTGMVVINADTGERHLIWAELDANASSPDGQALMIRPAINFEEGQRYIAAIVQARDADGQLLPVNSLFAAYRDGRGTGVEVLEQRRPGMEDIFARLSQAGFDRSKLTLAWDFTIASQQSLTGRLLAIRDDAFARLDGGAPRFTVNQVGIDIDGSPREGLSRGISGTFEVPNYLDQPGGVPGSQFYYDNDAADAVPTRAADDVFSARFRCQVPASTVADFDDILSPVTPARAALYGHGLFGEGPGGEFRAGNVRAMQVEHNILFCATDWYGMATEDFVAGVMHNSLADISHFPKQVDRSQQGLLAQMFLAELLRHPEGFASHPAFRHGPDDTLLFDPSEVFYDGNSQGGILGGALVATAPNIHRGVLGVPGSNYSLLLRRYGPFAERFGFIMYEAYTDELERSLVFALMQMLWDRAENNGYLSHLAGRHLPNTPTNKAVLLHVALGDYQVTHWSAEIMARTIGAAIHEPTLRLGDHSDENPYYGLPVIEQYPHTGHAIMIWDSGYVDTGTGRGNPLPPINNTGPDVTYGSDPHSSPRSTRAARAQKSAFMRSDGVVIDVCGDGPCLSDDHTGVQRP